MNTSSKAVFVSFSTPALRHAVTEQLMVMGYFLSETPQKADLVIADNMTEAECPHFLLGRHTGTAEQTLVFDLPLRLGVLTDQVRYLLSGRTKYTGQGTGPLGLGKVTLYPAESLIIHNEKGYEIRLTDKERQFLMTLFAAPRHTMDRKSLLEAVWDYADGVETHTLETHLYRLRQKLESCGETNLIVSENGMYRLVIDG